MKLRLLLMGCIISALGGVLLIARGFSLNYVGLLIVGIVLLVVGLPWKQTKKADSIRRETD
jgi:glucose uptake protein GlcU